ncbi:proline-rich protein 19 [Heteronotia binoei]|uniref:proline-rich protein 19 n=1 Tax=Heteronotia binoei TaxID=13085 RepID=UPI0029314239|nr:proline-rich protein 19 [Heteronotia binoei]
MNRIKLCLQGFIFSMNPCGKGERNQHPVGSAGLPCSCHQLKASLTEQNSSGEKPIRVKRRRTRRERNDVKFGRNGTDSVLEQRPSYKGLQKALPPFWSSQLTHCAKPASFKGISGTKRVIITQNRLSQHLGMFNKEVKSVNIERLLNPGCKQDFVEASPLRRDSGVDMQVEEESQVAKSTGSDRISVPCEQLGSSGSNLCGTNEDSLPVVVPAVSAVVTEQCSTTLVDATDPRTQSLVAPAVEEVNHQSDADPCQSNATVVANEKENVPPASPAGSKSHNAKSLARELAHDLEKRLNLEAIFPGRNLINETRQAIISTLLEQKRKLPDVSVWARCKKLAGSSKGGAVQADFRTPAGRDQESKSSGSSWNSSQGIFPKKKRSRDLFFLTSPILPSLAQTAVRTGEERPSPGEDMDFFVEPDRINQQSFGLAAVQPHPRSPFSQHANSTAQSSLAPERHPLWETLLKTTWPWDQGLRDVPRQPRSRQERAEVAYRPLQKKTASQRHYSSSGTWDSWSLANGSKDNRCPSQFPVVDSQQYSYVNELGSEQWSLQEAEPVPVHRLHLSQKPWDSQTLGVGIRSTERAASESQTSFDVLKSIWSPNVPRALGCPFLAQPSSLREPNSYRDDFFQLYNVSPEQNCCLHRQNPQSKLHVPGRHPLNGHWVFSGPAKPKTHHQKAALEPGRISNSYPFWGPSEASMRMQGTTEKGCSSSRIQACGWERLSQMEELQQLRLFQQLPMSYFPPSEVLENKQSPFHTLQDHLLGQSSPEPWSFPRMKLY